MDQQPLKLSPGSGLRTGAAFFIGYMLGRSRRTKLAAGVGLALVAQSMSGGGLPLGKSLKSALGGGPLGKVVEEVSETVAGVAQQAFNERIERISDALHERTSALQVPARSRADADASDEEEPENGSDEEPEDEEPEEDEEPARAGASNSGTAGSRRPAARAPSGRQRDRS